MYTPKSREAIRRDVVLRIEAANAELIAGRRAAAFAGVCGDAGDVAHGLIERGHRLLSQHLFIDDMDALRLLLYWLRQAIDALRALAAHGDVFGLLHVHRLARRRRMRRKRQGRHAQNQRSLQRSLTHAARAQIDPDFIKAPNIPISF
ncbi:MAG: hypothetical protein WDM79_17060 [Terricaulis sp.]